MGSQREQAEHDYMQGMKYKDLADKYGVTINTIKSWKTRYQWDRKNGAYKEKGCTQNSEGASNGTHAPVDGSQRLNIQDEPPDLSERQVVFCLHFLKSRNATMAALKAGYAKSSAHVAGCRLLKNDKVREYLNQLRQDMRVELFLEAADVIQEYLKIAFADMSDYVEFGQKEILVGVTKQGEPITRTVNRVDFKDHTEVDGTLIKEVKNGKDGVSIKLHDKMKALEKLEKYLDLLPDHHKRRVEEERLKLDRERFDHEKSKGGDSGKEQSGDWVTALQEVANRRKKSSSGDDHE